MTDTITHPVDFAAQETIAWHEARTIIQDWSDDFDTFLERHGDANEYDTGIILDWLEY